MPLRNIAPAFIKQFVWNRKPINQEIRPDLCPSDFVTLLSHRLSSTSSLVDLGCGPGNLLAALRSRGWQGLFIGVDISSKAIELAKSLGDKRAEWIVCPIEAFPARDVEAVSFLESLYYARSVPQLLSRWRYSTIYARIVHADRHADVISHLRDFEKHGNTWIRGPLQKERAVRTSPRI